MTIVAWIVVLICITITGGCSCAEQPMAETAKMESSQLLEVERFLLTEESLSLNYRVTNIFPHDIWICTTLDAYPMRRGRAYSVDTRITDGTLWIRCRGNMEQNQLVESTILAAYQRLRPWQSRSDTVLLALPVRNSSLVYEAHEPFSRVVLDRVVLELGYFSEEMSSLPSQSTKRALPKDSDKALVQYVESVRWEELAREQSMQVTISDVAIPGVRGGFFERLEHGIAPYTSSRTEVED